MSAISLSTLDDMLGAIGRARHIAFDAYVLENRKVIDALEDAARRGADVAVHLCEKPRAQEELGERNAGLSKDLSDAGVHVTKDPPFGSHSRHDKVAVIDGRVFSDDRNWTTGDTEIILSQHGAQASHVCTKQAALAAESDLIRNGSGHDVLVSTESLGDGPVVDALLFRAARGDHVRVICNADDHTRHLEEVLRELEAAHVELATSSQNHKLAIVGNRAWVGSANATCTRGSAGLVREWSQCLSGRLAQKLAVIAERTWDAAYPPMYGHP